METISHESIYTWLYALPKGELARLGVDLRSGRERHKPRGRKATPGARIAGMRLIDERPQEVADRQTPGHWEGDHYRQERGERGTLVERKSRFTLIVPLPRGRTACGLDGRSSGSQRRSGDRDARRWPADQRG
jgi:IS30 family transposase